MEETARTRLLAEEEAASLSLARRLQEEEDAAVRPRLRERDETGSTEENLLRFTTVHSEYSVLEGGVRVSGHFAGEYRIAVCDGYIMSSGQHTASFEIVTKSSTGAHCFFGVIEKDYDVRPTSVNPPNVAGPWSLTEDFDQGDVITLTLDADAGGLTWEAVNPSEPDGGNRRHGACTDQHRKNPVRGSKVCWAVEMQGGGMSVRISKSTTAAPARRLQEEEEEQLVVAEVEDDWLDSSLGSSAGSVSSWWPNAHEEEGPDHIPPEAPGAIKLTNFMDTTGTAVDQLTLKCIGSYGEKAWYKDRTDTYELYITDSFGWVIEHCGLYLYQNHSVHGVSPPTSGWEVANGQKPVPRVEYKDLAIVEDPFDEPAVPVALSQPEPSQAEVVHDREVAEEEARGVQSMPLIWERAHSGITLTEQGALATREAEVFWQTVLSNDLLPVDGDNYAEFTIVNGRSIAIGVARPSYNPSSNDTAI
eukprot:COSAG02_NODE_11247_length_1761_cov_1.632972_2_plen_474_part_01